jgi:hypothetical protein
MLVSVTRLRLRTWWFLLPFAIHAARSQKQAQLTRGCLSVAVRRTQGPAFWTLTAWESEAALKSFMASGPHRIVMPKLQHWCDEAAVAHWMHDENVAPTWHEATVKLQTIGRLPRVLHPSVQQQAGTVNVS